MSVAPFDFHASPLVAPLSHFGRNDLALAGGKGANLGELLQSGFDVPFGFIITTAAYDLLLQENHAQTHVVDMLANLDVKNPDVVKKISQQIQYVFQQLSIPRQIVEEIQKAYRELGGSAVAVRSSATAEDLPEAAFAGQQETFLNVEGESALIEAVRACWMSLWSERAILYRTKQNIDQSAVKLAVVVQKMVPADIAGVMFTANPISGAREELIIDASLGLGEAVVSGMVTPDHFIVEKRSRRIKAQQLGKREVIIRPKIGGGTEQISLAQETTNTAALAPQEIRKLSQLGMEVERHYGIPQDIEWAWIQEKLQKGKFLLLQARPMTALPEPLRISGPMRLVLPMLAEMWPTRPYPLDMTTFTGAVERAIGNLLVTMIGKSAPSPDEAFLEEDGVIMQFKPPQVHPSLSMLFTPWITMWRTRRNDPSRWEADPLLAELIAKARVLEQRDLKSLSWTQNVEIMHESLALIPRTMELRERYLPQAILGLASLWLLLALTGHRNSFGILTAGVKTKTTETNEALEALATQIRIDPSLRDIFNQVEGGRLQTKLKLETFPAGNAFLKQFNFFLDQYGHRETALLISQPAWKDQPEVVLEILKVLAGAERRKPDQKEGWQKTRDELLAHSVLGTRGLRTPFLKLLRSTRALFQIREDTHFYVTLVQPTLRHVALELGRRLVQAGALDKVEDVFHLQLDELETLGTSWPLSEKTVATFRTVVARRSAKRERLANKPMIDPRLLSLLSQAPGSEGVLLNGTSGSPGVARGPAKVVHDVSEFGKLRAGDVLVAPVTNPAWTPLFQRAVAVVVDTGGSASHAAIVAREYGIPAVMGTLNGTSKLNDGGWIQVDGSRGVVVKVEASK